MDIASVLEQWSSRTGVRIHLRNSTTVTLLSKLVELWVDVHVAGVMGVGNSNTDTFSPPYSDHSKKLVVYNLG